MVAHSINRGDYRGGNPGAHEQGTSIDHQHGRVPTSRSIAPSTCSYKSPLAEGEVLPAYAQRDRRLPGISKVDMRAAQVPSASVSRRKRRGFPECFGVLKLGIATEPARRWD